MAKLLVSLDRFKDGSIVEAVVWRGKGIQRHRIVEQVKEQSSISLNSILFYSLLSCSILVSCFCGSPLGGFYCITVFGKSVFQVLY